MTWNIIYSLKDSGKNNNKIIENINSNFPDILCTQEYNFKENENTKKVFKKIKK